MLPNSSFISCLYSHPDLCAGPALVPILFQHSHVVVELISRTSQVSGCSSLFQGECLFTSPSVVCSFIVLLQQIYRKLGKSNITITEAWFCFTETIWLLLSSPAYYLMSRAQKSGCYSNTSQFISQLVQSPSSSDKRSDT